MRVFDPFVRVWDRPYINTQKMKGIKVEMQKYDNKRVKKGEMGKNKVEDENRAQKNE